MTDKFDVAIVGGGVNGMTAALVAARKGLKTVLIERHDQLGGQALGDEFAPGFQTVGMFHDTRGVRRHIVEDLDLAKHGLKMRQAPLPIFHPEKDGPGLCLLQDPAQAKDELGRLSDEDVKGYQAFRGFVGRVKPFVKKVFDVPPMDLLELSGGSILNVGAKALALRMLGRADMMEILRLAPMCVADILNEHFKNDLIKAIFAVPAVNSSFAGPWSPATATNLLLEEALADSGVEGGPLALAEALIKAVNASQVEVRTGISLEECLIDREGKLTGLKLKGAGELQATKVIATCDPKTLFYDSIDPVHLGYTFAERVRNYRVRGITAKVDLGLKAPMRFQSRPDKGFEHVVIGGDIDTVEQSFDPVKYGEVAAKPSLELYLPKADGRTVCSDGQDVCSVLVHFVSHTTTEPEASVKEKILTATLDRLQEFAPNIKEHVVQTRVMTPKDIEARYGCSGGHRFHGEMSLDQLIVRPLPEASQYQTPFAGLYLAGQGSHPGGGLTLAPGYFGARVALG